MIISNTNHALFDNYSAKNKHSNTATNYDAAKSISVTSNVIAFSDYELSRSSYAFKEYLGFRANHALKQYSVYDNLETKENVDKALGISVYA